MPLQECAVTLAGGTSESLISKRLSELESRTAGLLGSVEAALLRLRGPVPATQPEAQAEKQVCVLGRLDRLCLKLAEVSGGLVEMAETI